MKVAERKYWAICPKCQRKIFRARVADIEEYECPKCRSKLSVIIEQGSVQIREADFEYEAHGANI